VYNLATSILPLFGNALKALLRFFRQSRKHRHLTKIR
jgi:hypothetical protein